MSLARDVQPEWLDSLPPAAPEARASRRDLQRLNRVMRHPGIVARAIQRCAACAEPFRLIDIGAGDGAFLLAVARLSPSIGPVKAVLVDRTRLLNPETIARFRELGWDVELISTDIVDALDRLQLQPPADVMIANLFLHHFDDATLRTLLRSAASCCRAFIACEPRRGRLGIAGAATVGLLGCNSVTRHDAMASVRAGFSGCDISRLWPPGWRIEERRAGLFSHLFCACRRPEAAPGGAETAPEMETILRV